MVSIGAPALEAVRAYWKTGGLRAGGGHAGISGARAQNIGADAADGAVAVEEVFARGRAGPEN